MKKKNSTLATLKRRYTALHEGRSPDRIVKEKLPSRPPKYFVELGPIPELMYLKKTTEGDDPFPYRHEFAEWAQPTLVHDEKGKLHIVDQDRLITTDHGIEDNHMKRHRRHSRSILRANPSHRGHRFLARHNPLNAATFKKVAVSSLAVGVGASVVAIGLNMLLDKLATPSAGSTPSPWFTDGYKRAALQAGGGLVIATALQSYGMENAAAIFGIGGVTAATLGAYSNYRTLHPAGAVRLPLASVPTYAPVSAAR